MKNKRKPFWLAGSQCQGKHRFADRGTADRVAHQMMRRKDTRAGAYRCSTCGGWHIGTGRGGKDK